MSKSTTHRILRSLQKENFVVQDPLTLKYSLGPLFAELSISPKVSHPILKVCAADGMEYLHELTTETVALVIRTGLQRMMLEELVSFHQVKYSGGIGSVAPIHAGATGKVLLAEMPVKDMKKLLDLSDLVSVGPNTITDRGTLLEELQLVKRQGYAVSFGEITTGAVSLAVPIHNYFIPVAMNILGPDTRFTKEKIKETLPEAKRTAAKISQNILKFMKKTG